MVWHCWHSVKCGLVWHTVKCGVQRLAGERAVDWFNALSCSTLPTLAFFNLYVFTLLLPFLAPLYLPPPRTHFLFPPASILPLKLDLSSLPLLTFSTQPTVQIPSPSLTASVTDSHWSLCFTVNTLATTAIVGHWGLVNLTRTFYKKIKNYF